MRTRSVGWVITLVGLAALIGGALLGAMKITPSLIDAPWMGFIALGLIVITFGGVMLLLFTKQEQRPGP